jgi:phosphocarrier protein FPr
MCLNPYYSWLYEGQMLMKVTNNDITLSCRAASREEALRLADSELARKRAVDAGFLNALIERERELSTWVGAGVALPHINRRDSHLVRKSCFHILQFPDGVKWDKGRVAFLVVVVAAKDNEHLDILSAMANLLDDERLVDRLSVAKSSQEFIALLQPE